MKLWLRILFVWLGWLLAAPAGACTVCRPRVQATIHGPGYTANLLLLLLPVALLVLAGVGLFYFDDLKQRFTRHPQPHG